MIGGSKFVVMGMSLALASAQLAALPECALDPALAVIGGQTKCQLAEFDCICSDSSLLQSLSSAVQNACTNQADLETAQAAASTLCIPYGNDAASVTSAMSDTTRTGSAYVTSTAPYAVTNSTMMGYATGTVHVSASSSLVASSPLKTAAAVGRQQGRESGVVAALAAMIGVAAII